ncbi:MAG: tetratricopeptide repeat protein [bacterium]
MPKQEQKASPSTLELAAEVSCYPFTAIIPFFVFREYFINYPLTSNPFYAVLAAILSALAFTSALIAAGMRDQKRPVTFPALILLAETLFFGTFFVIFRSFESFRLPQQTLIQSSIFFILFLFVLTSALKGKIAVTHVPMLDVPTALITLVTLLSLLWTPSFFMSLKEIVLYLSIVLTFYTIIQYFNTRSHFYLLIALVLVISTLEAAIGILQHLGWLNKRIGLGDNRDPFSTLGNKNYVAELLAMLVPFSVACFFHFRRAALRVAIAANIALMLSVVVVSQTRGSWIGLGAGSAVFILLLARGADRATLIRALQVFALVAAVAVSIMWLAERGIFFGRPGTPYLSRITTVFRLGDESIQSRLYIWGGSWAMIKKHPLTGVGIGAYKIKYLDSLKSYLREKKLKTIPGFFRDVNAKEAHNEYIHFLAELGPLGLLFVFYFIYSLWLFFRRVFRYVKDPPSRIILTGCFSALVGIGVSAVFGFPFRIVPTAMIICSLLALMTQIAAGTHIPAKPRAETDDGGKNRKKRKKNKKREEEKPKPEAKDSPVRVLTLSFAGPSGALATLAFAAVSCLVFVFSFKIQYANITLKLANFHAQSGRAEEAAEYYRQSLRDDPYNGDVHLFLGMFYQQTGEYDKAIREFKIARSYYDLPQIQLDLGAVYFQKGPDFYPQAEESFLESISVFPNYPLPRYNLGLIYYQREVYEKAVEWLLDAIRAQGNFYNAYFKLALAYEKMATRALSAAGGEADGSAKRREAAKYRDLAVENYMKTLEYKPDYADAYYNLGLLMAQMGSDENELADTAISRGSADESAEHIHQANQYFEKARENFEKTVAVQPNHVKALNNLGNIYYKAGLTKEAEKLYHRALWISPDYPNSRMNVALLYIDEGRYAEAAPYLEPLLNQSLDPEQSIKVHFMLGTCYMNLNRLDAAAEMMRAAVDGFRGTPYQNTQPYVGTIIRLADVYFRQKRYGECLALLSGGFPGGHRVHEMDWLYFTGACAVNSGRAGSAAGALRTLATRYPDTQKGRWARQTLEKISAGTQRQ